MKLAIVVGASINNPCVTNNQFKNTFKYIFLVVITSVCFLSLLVLMATKQNFKIKN